MVNPAAKSDQIEANACLFSSLYSSRSSNLHHQIQTSIPLNQTFESTKARITAPFSLKSYHSANKLEIQDITDVSQSSNPVLDFDTKFTHWLIDEIE